MEIAPTGHADSQEPQLTQESEITNAIFVPSLYEYRFKGMCVTFSIILIQKYTVYKYENVKTVYFN